MSERVVAARQMTLRGTDALQRGHWEEAESIFASAIRQCPVDERARSGYAESLWQRGACDTAIVEMEQAVKLSGGNHELLVRLGEMRLARGDRDGAAACAEKALAAQRELATAWALQGDVLRAQGQLDDALASYHRALSCQAHQPRVQLAAAEIYRYQNRPQRALSTLESLADNYGPGQVPTEVLYLQGVAQKALRRYDDAVASFVAASKQGASTADVLCELAECQMLAGDLPAARLTALEGLRRDPQSEAFQRLVARLDSDQPRVASLQRASANN